MFALIHRRICGIWEVHVSDLQIYKTGKERLITKINNILLALANQNVERLFGLRCFAIGLVFSPDQHLQLNKIETFL